MLKRNVLGFGIASILALILYSYFIAHLIRKEASAHIQAETLAEENANEIARRMVLERRLVSHQKLEALGTMMGGIAHSINNFLAPILILTTLLKKDAAPGGDQERNLEYIRRAATNAADMLKDVLAFARNKPDGNTASTDLVACLLGSLKVARAAAPSAISIEAEIAPSEAWVNCKESELETIILNLINNAIDAVSISEGRIDVTLKAVSATSCRAAGFAVDIADGQYYWLRVKDTGYGICDEILPRIFDPFFTTKEVGKGSGLGLSISYTIITKIGGDIIASSPPGEGACFDLFFPMTANRARM